MGARELDCCGTGLEKRRVLLNMVVILLVSNVKDFCFLVEEHLTSETAVLYGGRLQQNSFVVCFLLGNSSTSEFYMPTFRNTLLVSSSTYPPMKMEQTECSETSAYKIQTPGNYPEGSIQHSEHGECMKSKGSFIQQTVEIIPDRV